MSAFDPRRTSCRGAKYQNLHTIKFSGVLILAEMEASLTKTYSGSRECLVGRLLNAVEHNDANDSENDRSNAGK